MKKPFFQKESFTKEILYFIYNEKVVSKTGDFKECKGGFGMGEEESELLKVLKGFKERISQKYNIKEMILFSSQVSVEADENSDIDLIVVGEEFEEKRKEISIVRPAIKEGITI